MSENITTLDRAEQIRQELRDGRRNKGADSPAERASQDAGGNGQIDGSQLQILPGESKRADQADRGDNDSHRGDNDSQRSAEAQPERVRRAARRLSESHKRADDPVSSTTAASSRTIGRLEANEPIPSRLPESLVTTQEDAKRGRGRPPTKKPDEQPRETPITRISKGFKEGKVLTRKEADEIKEAFIDALRDDFKYLDEALWWYSHDSSEPQIWGDLDDEEIEIIARVLLRRGERSPAAATLVRNVIDASDYVNVAVITVPRTIKTMQQLNKRPPKQKKTKNENTH